MYVYELMAILASQPAGKRIYISIPENFNEKNINIEMDPEPIDDCGEDLILGLALSEEVSRDKD